MSSFLSVSIAVTVFGAFLWAIYRSAKDAGAAEERSRIDAINNELIRKQTSKLNEHRTIEDIARDADAGDF